VLERKRVAHLKLRQETVALWDFNPAYVGSGSFAS
jgi:hypothetical protein